MQSKYLRHTHGLKALALVGGFGLLTACPLDPSASGSGTDTNVGTTTGTTGDSSTETTGPDPTTTTGDAPTTTTGPDPTTTTTTTTDPTTTTTTGDVDGALCVALGGVDGVGELVADAVARVTLDDRINAYFLNSDVDAGNLVSCLEKQVGELAGCLGVMYDCMDMQAAHAGLGVSAVDFADFAADFSLALDAHQAGHPTLTDGDKEAILAELAGMSDAIVEDPTDDLTIYQRVGRKPAITALIGAPGEAGSFADTVAINPAINGFFAMADHERFNTCLTRQLGGIDGPSKYGLEVDAPAPADPGVGAGDPCKSMLEAHVGLVDVNDDIGIDINDFNALVADLVTAMTTADVDPADQDAILTVLGPMCEDIVMPEHRNECPSAQKLEVVEATMIAAMIPDAIYDGTLDTMLCQDLVVPDDPINFVSDVALTVAMDHTWVGDVTLKLVSPDTTILTLVSRPGLDEMVDDGSDCCGRSSNLSKLFPLNFKGSAVTDAEQLGAALNNTNHVICDDDGIDPCDWSPNPGAGPGLDFTDFHGEAAAGTWKLCLGDSNLNDFGSLDAVTLSIARVKYDPKP